MTLKHATDLAFQGDIALLKVDVLPEGAEKITQALNSAEREAYGYHPQKGLVLAQGESRNHFHAFRDTDKVEMYRVANDNNRLYVVVKEPTTLLHEEHNPICFDPAIYRLIFQQEWTFEDEYARVAD